MGILIKGGRVIDPAQGFDGLMDILIDGESIRETGPTGKLKSPKGVDIIDASGKLVVPGLIDMHCHLREPGFEYKEDIDSGTTAAVAGGFTTVCCMPNTNPVNDNRAVTEYIINRARVSRRCKVLPIGAITKGSAGVELSEMGDLADAGCVGFSDDGKPVVSAEMMRHALEYSKSLGIPVVSHCEDPDLSSGGVMHEGAVSTRLGLKGIPSAAEDVMVGRDIELLRLTGGRLHTCHVSTRGAVKLIRRAKSDGLAITAETCPHYFTLTDKEVMSYNTNFKVNPPLRTEDDREAILEGLADGTLDVIATDHAPHAASEKEVEFDLAPFGISGFETALALSLKVVNSGRLSLTDLIAKLTINPAAALGLELPSLKAGSPADIVVIDPMLERRVRPDEMHSKGRNTAFAGMVLKGWPVVTIYKGSPAWRAE